MATNQRTIDLLIRAKLQGVRDIAEVAKSVDTLSEAVANQSKSVVKTVEAFDQLKASRSQLADLSKEISEVGKLTRAYELQQASLDKNEAKLKQQESALASLNEQISKSKSNSVSQTKIDKQNALTQSIERQQEALDKNEAKLKKQESALASLNEQISKSNSVSQTKIDKQTALTKSIERQQASLDKNKTKLKEQESALASLNEQISKSNSVSQTKIDKQASLTQSIERTRNAIVQDKKAVAELSETLSRAGINTSNYTAATEKLKQMMDATTNAAAQARKKVDDVNLSQQNGIKLQRTSLDLYQRIRGQVMSVTATYVGLYGAINLVNESIEAQGRKESVIAQLSVATGDAKSAEKEYEYLIGQAQRLGLEVSALAPNFAKLSTSMKLSGSSTEEIRFVFESFAETARALKFSNEEVGRGVYAISQIFSKGKVTAEDFNGQLGDLLPGLQGVAKAATGDKFKDFNDAMKDGKVTLADFITIMAKYRETMQGPLAQAINSVQADQARLNNEITFFKEALAKNGVTEEYRKLILELTKFFQSNEGKEFAKDLADAFRLFGQVLRVVVQNFDLLIKSAGAVVVYKALTGLWKELIFIKGLLDELPAKFTKLSTFLVSWGKNLARFGRGGIIGLVVFGSFSLATYLYEQFPAVKEAVDKLVSMLNLNFGGSLEKTAKQAAARLGQIAKKASLTYAMGHGGISKSEYDAAMAKVDADFLKKSREIWAKKPAQATSTKSVMTPQGVVTPRPTPQGGNTPTIIDEAAANKARTLIENVGNAISSMEQRLKTKTADTLQEKLNALNTEFTQIEVKLAKIGSAKVRAGMQKRLAVAREQLKTELLDDYNKAISESLDKLDAQVQNKTADTLEQKINAIEQQYGKLATDIEQVVDKTLREQYGERLIRAREQLKLEVIEEFQAKLLSSKNALEQDILNVEAEAGRKSKLDLDARLSAIDAKYADSFKKIADYRKQLIDSSMSDPSVDAQENRLVLAVKENKELETRKFYLEEVARLEKVVSDLVQARNARLQAIENQKDVGALTELQALQETARVVSETQPQILSAAKAFQDFATANREAFGLENQQAVGEWSAKVEEAVTSSGKLRTEIISAREIDEKLAQGGTQIFDSLAEGIANVATKTGSWGDAIEGVRNTFLRFAADFLREIATMILKQQLLDALQRGSSSSGSKSSSIAKLITTGLQMYFAPGTTGAQTSGASAALGLSTQSYVLHTGGVVGSSVNRTRRVPGVVFNNAPSYHSGGMAGLKQNEYATILERNEEVLTANNPRHVKNMAKNGTAQTAPTVQNTNIIAIDQRDVQNAAFGSGAQQKLINMINLNPSAFRTALRV